MKVVTAAEMREIDRITIEEYGVSGQALMERAGAAVAARAMDVFSERKAVVLCGGGNNGGDGLVAAINLLGRGCDARALILAEPGKLSADCEIQRVKAEAAGVPVEFRKRAEKADFSDVFVIDAVLGTGLSKPVTGDLAATFRLLNESGVPVLAVDIASGISSDTGQVLVDAVIADYTVTFGLPKRGHFLYPGARYCGCLYVEDIGFPEKLTGSNTIKTELFHRDAALPLIPARPRNSYKGDYGHILVVAGSRGKTGAALMTARACLRSGSGLVTIAVPESLMDIFQSRVTEEMVLPLPDKGDGTLDSPASEVILEFASRRADVIAIGPGIGVSPETEDIMNTLVLSSAIPLVIDADGLNSLNNAHETLGSAKAPIVVTPHPGEMARILKHASEVRSQDSEFRLQKPEFRDESATGIETEGKEQKAMVTIEDIEKDRINAALFFSQGTGVCTVLKGVPTIVADADGHAYINTSGNPGMATAGSGDVLTGIIASFIGQGMNTSSASALGVYMHGLAGDLAAEDKGEQSLVASDIILALPSAFDSLK
jgi:ADP-dependent NAD(P)H-hydrate dehydratase / NAD(P)H-hydrate epimerase